MKIAIAGGGIAGLSVAAVLAERGHTVRVFERHAGDSTGGGVVCFPNATLVLRRLGVEDDLRAVAGTPRTMRRMSKHGEHLGDLPLATIDESIGAPSYSVLRRDLHRLLSELARERGVELETSSEVLGVSADERLVLKDGRHIAADWLIGADGRMSSPLRRYVLGHNEPRYGGFVNWVGIARADEDVFDRELVLDLWGSGERFGLVPITRRTAYFAGGALAPLGKASQQDLLHLLKARFGAWPKPVGDALAAADSASLREIYVHDHDPVDVWHRGRVLLVGDAAHAPLPTSGQGACQAIEDAFHLGSLLDQGAPSAPAEFFPLFTARRRGKANAIIAAGRAFAAMIFDADPERVAERDRRSRQTDFSQAALAMAALWSKSLPVA